MRPDALDEISVDGNEQLLLATELVIERARGYAGARGDFADSDIRIAVLREQRSAGISRGARSRRFLSARVTI